MKARHVSRERLAHARPNHVLIVCYGNIYRSAFVGEFLRNRLAGKVQVRSTGFHSVPGRPSPERHVQMCKRVGISLEHHRSSVIATDDLAWADLIVLMDRHNWAALRHLGADERKLIWLGSLIDGPIEIPDPYTRGDREAEQIVMRMRDAAERLATQLSNQEQACTR
jgi:protein-tyrosine-phosphatase